MSVTAYDSDIDRVEVPKRHLGKSIVRLLKTWYRRTVYPKPYTRPEKIAAWFTPVQNSVVAFAIALFLAISWYTDTYWRDEEISMQNIYHEARGVPGKDYMGWKKIQAVVFNRMADRDFPKTMFGVITHKRPEKTKYEFSWLDDPKKWVEYPKDLSLMAEIRPVVRRAIIEHRFGFWEDPTGGALAYHAVTMKPNEFFKRWDLIDYEVEIKNRAELDGHLYYTRPGDGQRSDKAAAVKSRVANVAPVPPAKPRR